MGLTVFSAKQILFTIYVMITASKLKATTGRED